MSFPLFERLQRTPVTTNIDYTVHRWALRLILGGGLVIMVAGATLAANPNCGDTITQSTRLDGDLVDCPGDAIVIGADGITLDLNGHLVDGQGTGAGIRIAFRKGVTVKNGVVSHFNQGVVLDTSTETRILSLVLLYNGRAIDVASSSKNLIKRNRAFASQSDGIRLGLSSNNKVERNVVIGNVFGVSVANGSNGNIVKKNSVTNNGAFGIAVFENSDDNHVEENFVVGNGERGIYVLSGSDDTRVKRNDVSGNGEDGIRVEAESMGTVIDRNSTDRNGQDGIFADGTETTVRKNKAYGNENLGIEAMVDIIDGGGNEAQANGNPAQCLEVDCSPKEVRKGHHDHDDHDDD